MHTSGVRVCKVAQDNFLFFPNADTNFALLHEHSEHGEQSACRKSCQVRVLSQICVQKLLSYQTLLSNADTAHTPSPKNSFHPLPFT